MRCWFLGSLAASGPALAQVELGKTGPASAAPNATVVYRFDLGMSGPGTSATTLQVMDLLPAGMTATAAAPVEGIDSVSCTNLNVAGALLDCTVMLPAGLLAGNTTSDGKTVFSITATAPASLGTAVTGSTGVLPPATAAPGGTVTLEASVGLTGGACVLSSFNTDPVTGAAYLLVEPSLPTTPCRLVVTQMATSAIVADLTTTGAVVAVYLAQAGLYQYDFQQTLSFADAVSYVTISGSPALPPLPAGSVTTANCARALEKRALQGYEVSQYAGGWNIGSSTDGTSNCPFTVQPNALGGPVSVTTNLVQVAVRDPFDLSIIKSAWVPPPPASAGQNIALYFTLINNGTVPFTVSVTDPLVAGPINCPVNPLPAGSSEICTAQYPLTATDIASGSVTNSASVSGVDDARTGATQTTVVSSNSMLTMPLSPVSPTLTNYAAVNAVPGPDCAAASGAACGQSELTLDPPTPAPAAASIPSNSRLALLLIALMVMMAAARQLKISLKRPSGKRRQLSIL